MQRKNQLVSRIVGAVAIASAGAASAQYETGFERTSGVNGAPNGILLTGQDGYYNPIQGSTDMRAFTYSGNTLGLPNHPRGGGQFVGGMWPGQQAFVRAQRDLQYGSGRWQMTFDLCVAFRGNLPAVDNIGSVSMQPTGASQSIVALARWADPNTAQRWNADYVWYTADGVQVWESVPDPAFQNLLVNRWYQWATVVDFDTNQVLSVAIEDIVTGQFTAYFPQDRYLEGGQGGGFPRPTAYRMFIGGSGETQFGNTIGFDNVIIGRMEPRREYFPVLDVAMQQCPGTLDLSWRDAPPNKPMGVVIGNRLGETPVFSGICAGSLLGLSGSVQLVGTVNSGPNGSGQVQAQVGGGACGKYLQLVIPIEPSEAPCITSCQAPIMNVAAGERCRYGVVCFEDGEFDGVCGAADKAELLRWANAWLARPIFINFACPGGIGDCPLDKGLWFYTGINRCSRVFKFRIRRNGCADPRRSTVFPVVDPPDC